MAPAWASTRSSGAWWSSPPTLPCHSAGGRRRRPHGSRRSLTTLCVFGLAAALLIAALPGGAAPGAANAVAAEAAAEDAGLRGSPFLQVTEWARKAGGGFASVAVISLAEIVAILLCIPGYSALDYAAGAIFGFGWGVVVVASAKCVAALIAYALIRSLKDSAWGRWAQQKVLGSGDRGGLSTRIQKGVEQGSFKFCLLVRCSPLPAWLSNYALPLAGVPFTTYLISSVIGMLPPLLTNVYAGAMTAAVVSTVSGGSSAMTSGPGGVIGLFAVGISVLSSTLLVGQLSGSAGDATVQPQDFDESEA